MKAALRASLQTLIECCLFETEGAAVLLPKTKKDRAVNESVKVAPFCEIFVGSPTGQLFTPPPHLVSMYCSR